VASGVCLGLALSTKFSALVLLPILLIHTLIRRWQVPGEWPARKILRSILAASSIAFAVIWALYRFDVGTVSSAGLVDKAAKIEALSKLGRALPLVKGPLLALANTVPVPAPQFFRGIVAIGHMHMVGRETYVLGKASSRPPWYYSPVALAVKTPASIIGLVVAASILFWRRRRNSWRAAPFVPIVLITSPLLYLSITSVVGINSGIRSLLPAYAFVFIAIAAVLVKEIRAGWVGRAIAAAGLLGLLVESVLIYPHHLSFFNALVGGPSNGPKYLLDSNIDWGQDLKYLRAYTNAQGGRNLCLSYYGNADPGYYGISYQPVPRQSDLSGVSCIVAVSVTNLYNPDGPFGWLRAIAPKARIGNTIYVYDLGGAGATSGSALR
jgi:4-amino-4-deoxy-L-arabinose transferase-like glycosyltransferase